MSSVLNLGGILASGSLGRRRQLLAGLAPVLLAGAIVAYLSAPPASPREPAAVPATATIGETTASEGSFLAAYQEPTAGEAQLTPVSLVEVVLKLSAVLVLVWLGARGAKRFLAGTAIHPSGGLIRVVETSYLGPRRSLHFVQVADKLLLVGSTDQQVALLAEWPDAGVLAELQERARAAESAPDSFSRHLAASLGQLAGPAEAAPAARVQARLAQLRARLDTLARGNGTEGQPR